MYNEGGVNYTKGNFQWVNGIKDTTVMFYTRSTR